MKWKRDKNLLLSQMLMLINPVFFNAELKTPCQHFLFFLCFMSTVEHFFFFFWLREISLFCLNDFILFLCLFCIFKLRILATRPEQEETNQQQVHLFRWEKH